MSRPIATVLTLAVLGVATACLSPAARDTDTMSVVRHDAVASREEATANRLAAARATPSYRLACAEPGREQQPCWRIAAGQTAEMMRHHEVAEAHRAASRSLRIAEAKACVDLSPDDRDISPFAHRADVLDVVEVFGVERGRIGGRLVGARITFLPVPNLTRALLQRMVDCHLARNAALGHESPEMPYCPLVADGVRATVVESGGRLSVEVVSDDSKTALEVLRRSRWLITP